jgi:hypothetical protein
MPRSIHVVGSGALVLLACAQTSQQPATVTAPTASTATAEVSAQAASASEPPVAASAPEEAAPVARADADAGPSAQYRSCQADADCVAVPRAGCCHNGWKEAVNVSQKDAYEQANACTSTRRPICPMFMVRDTRVARCDTPSHLCEMVKP